MKYPVTYLVIWLLRLLLLGYGGYVAFSPPWGLHDDWPSGYILGWTAGIAFTVLGDLNRSLRRAV